MRSFVDFQVLRTGKHLPAGRKRARERLLARVHADMIDQLVLRLERPAVARAAEPEAGVRRTLRPTDVVHRQVRDDLLHRAEDFVARLAATAVRPGPTNAGGQRRQTQPEMVVVVVMVRRQLRLHPQALHLLLDRRRVAHVPEERPGRPRVDGQVGERMVLMVMVHGRGVVALVMRMVSMVSVRMGVIAGRGQPGRRHRAHRVRPGMERMVPDGCSRRCRMVVQRAFVRKQGRRIGRTGGGRGRTRCHRGRAEVIVVTLERQEVPRMVRGHRVRRHVRGRREMVRVVG